MRNYFSCGKKIRLGVQHMKCQKICFLTNSDNFMKMVKNGGFLKKAQKTLILGGVKNGHFGGVKNDHFGQKCPTRATLAILFLGYVQVN